MKTVRQTFAQRAWWGPVESEVSNERTMVRMRTGVQVELWCPLWQEGGFNQILTMLREGLPVLVDGEPRVVLRQPERKVWHRRDRRILVEGDPALVPPGLFFRARWQKGLGLEASKELGAPADRRLIRPPCDLGLGLPWYPRRFDRSLSLELVGLSLCVKNRLLEMTHIVGPL